MTILCLLKILCSDSNGALIAMKYDTEREMVASEALQPAEADFII